MEGLQNPKRMDMISVMSHILHTTDDVIDLFGGTKKTADLLDLKMTVVSNWRASGTFPAARYLVMSHELAKRGYAAPPSLWGLQEPGEKRRARA